MMISQRLRRIRALTLTEILIAAAIMTIVVLATITCRYHSALDAKRARMQVTAANVGLTLSESWRGLKGSETYDPTTHLGGEMTIASGAGPAEPGDFTKLGSYSVTSNGVTCFVTLSWKDVASGLRALNVNVAWTQQVKTVALLEDTDKVFELTTYTIN